jgi:F1F0 ATPase subunit 2
MMNEIWLLIPALLTGILLGVIFFGGLWWTVQKGLVSENPAVWFIASLFIRTAITVTGFYLMAAGSWQKLLACLTGFLFVRVMITHFYRSLPIISPPISKENHHAP